ncbi:unnamed protein product [Aureobasidium uvarum]|uniref:Uncharacterized protein n=1 Tax=Aureobasidium uvarum TaxID=2773716 RepID=A0A9N8KP88_9PEZI|nr:unnamed protein product [Aureobasidium uvarum]
MSTPMDDSFYSNDMDNYSLQQYTDFSDKLPYGGVDPRLLSSPQNTPLLSNEQPLSSFDYTVFSPRPPNPTFFEPDLSLHSYEPMRHQMLGHRRSVSVPPEDMMPETVQPPPALVFHRGGTPLGDSMGTDKGNNTTNKKWLKKAAAAQKRQIQRHSPYPTGGGRMQVQRSHTQPAFSQQQHTPHLGPTSAPQQMILTSEDQVSQAVKHNFDIGPLSSPQFADFNAIDAGGRNVHLPTELTDIDAFSFETRNDVNTAVLGMFGFAERLSKDCEAMRGFLTRGFGSGEEDEFERYVLLQLSRGCFGTLAKVAVLCSVRQEKRVVNHKASTLEDGLEMLPLPEGKAEEEVTVPVTGQDIRDLDGTFVAAFATSIRY